MTEVRCKTCNRLLAVVHDNGMIESKTARQAIWTERALLSCAKCTGAVLVDGREVIAKKFVDRKKKMR